MRVSRMSCSRIYQNMTAIFAFLPSWYHARTCLVAGIGFFTDSYDIFAISIASIMIGYIYGPHGALTANQELGIKVALPIGTFVGQLSVDPNNLAGLQRTR